MSMPKGKINTTFNWKRLFVLVIATFCTYALAFDKFDNTVCESSANDAARIMCFRELKLNESCQKDLMTELNCYKQSAATILAKQEQEQSAKQAIEASAKQQVEQKEYSYRSRISPSALSPYTQQAYPKINAAFGSRINDVESLRKKAAEMALDSGKCDFVELSELSRDKSTINNLQFWVDCANKQRIYLNEKEINSSAKVMTQADKAWKESDALSSCKELIMNNAMFPSSVDLHSIFGAVVFKAETTYNVLVELDFDAKNGFGVELPYKARCIFAPGEQGEISFSKR